MWNADSLRRFYVVVAGCIGIACALGIAVDLVTAHVAVEYFTVHHPRLIDRTDPISMALVWGVAATWWCGLIAGIVLAFVNQRLPNPLEPKAILGMVAKACAWLWVTMMLVLVAMYLVANVVPLEKRGPSFESDRRLMAVAVAHAGEYIFAGIAVMILLFKMRKRSSATPS
jgi:hypothetical protein